MFSVLSKFKVCQPATRQREADSFLSNYLTGVPTDFSDAAGFVFNGSVNEFTFDGITFNPIYPVDRYGIQENFEFPSTGLIRKEMDWNTSTHPVQINASTNSGFDIFGTYVGIKKISTTTSVSLCFMNMSAITGHIDSYNSTTGAFTFIYSELPDVYTETDSLGAQRFLIQNESNWAFSTYDSSLSSNTSIGTPYGTAITTLEKYKEVTASVSSFDTLNGEITGTMDTGLSSSVINNIQQIAPMHQRLRLIDLGNFDIADNALGNPVATSTNSLPSRSTLGISSYLYYGIPYQTGYSYSNTSLDYYVRTPVFEIDLASSDLRMFAVVTERVSSSRVNPTGFKMGMLK